MKNTNLHKAKRNKKDEFYTQLEDIEKELKHYRDHFKGKTVLCNCDDPVISNFFRFFSYNFEFLGLKKLITTCYKNQQTQLFSKHDTEKAIYLEYYGDKNGNKIPDLEEIGVRQLKGNGDFRSDECIDFLKEADIVCTNPPFSLFREYIAQLVEYEKKFLIIGNFNAVTYKEVFPLIKNNKMWLGVSARGMIFKCPNDTETAVNACWFTNLPHKKRNEELILVKKYKNNEKKYPKYDNYDAIEISETVEIPVDYDGVMGVPVSFLDKYNPAQFEIIGLGISKSGIEIGVQPYKEEHKKYRKEVQKRGAVDGDLYMLKNGIVTVPYARILVRRKQ